MAQKSKIEWTKATWNPVTGCTKISIGCKYCYAELMAKRLQAMGQNNYRNGFKVTLQPQILDRPLKWKKPQFIFVNSMSDLFHEDIPFEYIVRVFDIMNQANWHQFQILTKRSQRLKELNKNLNWTQNIWMGVTVENNDFMFRVDDLRETDAGIKFISFEPLINAINNLDLRQIDWIIVGGESGPKSRIMKKQWVLDIRDQSKIFKVPFFFKQWGGANKKKNGRILEGRTWDEMPNNVNSSLFL